MAVRHAIIGSLLVLALLPGLGAPAAGQEDEGEADAPSSQFPGLPLAQPSYDTLRVADNGETLPYHVWVDWVPELVTTPDGGAWAFFGAQARIGDGPASRRLFASRFDPDRDVWLPARAMPGDRVQFGPASVVDGEGRVHLVYSQLVGDEASLGSTLLYSQIAPGGEWSAPAAVAPDAAAGYQMMPALAVDKEGRVHAMWRDQRAVSEEARAAMAANADLFEATLVDGEWNPARQVTVRAADDINAAWPLLAVDGDRLVAVWSLYQGTTEAEMRTALRVEWSTRPVAGSGGWAAAKTLAERADDEVGGRLIDLAGSDNGLAIVYGRFAGATNQLALKRLRPGAADWDADIPLSTGDYGYLPTIAMTPAGDAYVAYNTRRNRNVEIGAVMIPIEGTASAPVSLTASEDGVQARGSIAVDARGRPWVVYMHQPAGGTAATEIRTLRGATLDE